MHCGRVQHCCCAAAKLQQLLFTAPRCLARSLAQQSACYASHTDQVPYSSQPVQQAQQVPVPLCRRPVQHTEQLAVLMQWRRNVLSEIQKVKESFAAADGGPSTADLQVGCWQLWDQPGCARDAWDRPAAL